MNHNGDRPDDSHSEQRNQQHSVPRIPIKIDLAEIYMESEFASCSGVCWVNGAAAVATSITLNIHQISVYFGG